MGKQVAEKGERGEKATVECCLPGITVAGSSNPSWEQVRTGATPVQMLCKARRVPRALSWVRLLGRVGDVFRPETPFQVPVPAADPDRGCSSRPRLAGAGPGERQRGGWPEKDTLGQGRGVPRVWAVGGAAGRRG